MVGVKGPVTNAGTTIVPTLLFGGISWTVATIKPPSGTGSNRTSVSMVSGRVMLTEKRNVAFMAASTLLKLTKQPVSLEPPGAKLQVTVPM